MEHQIPSKKKKEKKKMELQNDPIGWNRWCACIQKFMIFVIYDMMSWIELSILLGKDYNITCWCSYHAPTNNLTWYAMNHLKQTKNSYIKIKKINYLPWIIWCRHQYCLTSISQAEGQCFLSTRRAPTHYYTVRVEPDPVSPYSFHESCNSLKIMNK